MKLSVILNYLNDFPGGILGSVAYFLLVSSVIIFAIGLLKTPERVVKNSWTTKDLKSYIKKKERWPKYYGHCN